MSKLILILALALLSSCHAWGAIAHVAGACSSASTSTSPSNIFTFACTPNAANHAVSFMVFCTPGSGSATGATLTATGWTITSVDFTGSVTAGFAASFAAISPNTTATTFTATFTGAANCNSFDGHVNDEFSGTDTTGGATTFYAHNKNTNTTGGCSGASSTSTSANDVVWGACEDSLPATTWQGAGWTAGTTDSNGEGSEFKLATGAQAPTWASTSGAFNDFSIVILAAGGGGGTVRHRAWVINSQ